MTLGRKIKDARLARGMTQKEVVGDFITRNMLSKIENDSASPSVRTLERLAAALGLPTGYFLDEAEVSDGSSPDGLNEARAAYRAGRWRECLRLLEADSTAGTTDEGYLLHAHAGAYAARGALDAGDPATARELAEAAQYYNQEGMYYSPLLAAELTITLGSALLQLAEDGWEEQRAAFLQAVETLDAGFRGQNMDSNLKDGRM
jgi:transcriptional regulator with XRE-family HTH domain